MYSRKKQEKVFVSRLSDAERAYVREVSLQRIQEEQRGTKNK